MKLVALVLSDLCTCSYIYHITSKICTIKDRLCKAVTCGEEWLFTPQNNSKREQLHVCVPALMTKNTYINHSMWFTSRVCIIITWYSKYGGYMYQYKCIIK